MTREALKLALKALEDLGMKHFESTGEVLYKDTFTAIKEALAQPSVSVEQEPVKMYDGRLTRYHDGSIGIGTPPQRKPLTDEEINEFFQGMEPNNGFWLSFARAIEAAHGIKGEA